MIIEWKGNPVEFKLIRRNKSKFKKKKKKKKKKQNKKKKKKKKKKSAKARLPLGIKSPHLHKILFLQLSQYSRNSMPLAEFLFPQPNLIFLKDLHAGSQPHRYQCSFSEKLFFSILDM